MKKIEILVTLISDGDYVKALSLASKFPKLTNRKDIVSGHEALRNGGFYKQLGKDPKEMFVNGCLALYTEFKARLKKENIEPPITVCRFVEAWDTYHKDQGTSQQ